MNTVRLIWMSAALALAGCGGSVQHYFSRLPIDEGAIGEVGSVVGDGYTEPIRQTYIQAYEKAAYDILWVLDNSGSMVDEVNYVRDNMNNFMEIMKSRRQIQYQMAFINTDWRNTTFGNGQFRGGATIPGSPPIVRYTDADPVAYAKAAVNDIDMCPNLTGTGCGTSGQEMGLNAARTALTNNGSAFIRNDANLILVFVSDEEDVSCTPNGVNTCSSYSNRVAVSTFVTFFNGLKPSGTGLTAIYPMVGRNLSDCDTIASVGQRYLDVMTGVGLGESGSICENEFGTALDNLANGIAENGLCFSMAHNPKLNSIRVFVNGTLQTEGYSFDKTRNAACFDTNHVPVNGDRISLEYYRK